MLFFMAYYYVLSLFLSFFCEKGNCCDVYRFGGYIVMRLTLSCFFHLWTLDRKDDFDIEKVNTKLYFSEKGCFCITVSKWYKKSKRNCYDGYGFGAPYLSSSFFHFPYIIF